MAVNDLEIPGSDDAFVLIEGMDGVQGAYLGIGTADPEVVAPARQEGREFPFFAHEPNYVVHLDAIPLGAKIATVLVVDVLSK